MTTNHPATQQDFSGGTPEKSPSLDTQETTCHISGMLSYRNFLTSGIPNSVAASQRLYAAVDGRDGKNRTEAYNACRSSAWFVRHRVTGKIKLASSRCNLRWCPLCIKTKKYVMRSAITPWINSGKRPKFITLTLKHSEAPLSLQIESLYKFFGILRRRPRWKKRIIGGIWFFQITKSKNDELWHPHLHLVCDGKYFPHKELMSMWSEITHGSSIVDIRAVKNAKKVADYVARYATAPCAIDKLDDDDALAVFDALHGRRICGAFGTAKGLQLVPKKCPDSEEWEYLDSFGSVQFNRHKSDWHRTIYECFIKESYCPCSPNPDPPPESWTYLEVLYEPVNFKQMVFEFSSEI